MRFRESKPEDFVYMAEHSMNKTVDRKDFETVDYTYTLEHDGNPLCLGGFRMIVPTTAWCWIDLTKEATENMYTPYRVICEWMETFTKDMKIKRLQAFVRDIPHHIRLVEHLGFHLEGKMKNFYGDEDGLLYRRLF